MLHGVNKSCTTQHAVAKAATRLRSFPKTQLDIAGKALHFFVCISHCMLAVLALESWTWLPHLANFCFDVPIVMLSGSDSFSRISSRGERERERGGGGSQRLNRSYRWRSELRSVACPTICRQRRDKRDLNVSRSACQRSLSDKAHRSIPTRCLDPLESKHGFSHMSIFSQSAEQLHEQRQERSNFYPCYSFLEPHSLFKRSFYGFQKGQAHCQKDKLSKKFLLTIDFKVTTRGP